VPEPTVATALFIGAELAILSVAALVGGPPWTVLAALALVAESIGGVGLPGLVRLAPSLVWVVAFRLTGNRELFFPYAMYLAAHAGLHLAERDRRYGIAASLLMVAFFLAFRVAQGASTGVLAVELAVAVAIVVGLFVIRRLTPAVRHDRRDVALAVAASIAAYAGLAI
jgi:hypothetical protein